MEPLHWQEHSSYILSGDRQSYDPRRRLKDYLRQFSNLKKQPTMHSLSVAVSSISKPSQGSLVHSLAHDKSLPHSISPQHRLSNPPHSINTHYKFTKLTPSLSITPHYKESMLLPRSFITPQCKDFEISTTPKAYEMYRRRRIRGEALSEHNRQLLLKKGKSARAKPSGGRRGVNLRAIGQRYLPPIETSL